MERRIIAFLVLAATMIFMMNTIKNTAGATGASASVLGSTHGNTTNLTPTTIYAQAGNVTELSINGTEITSAWQGYFGNVSGNITLGNSAGFTFYSWPNIGTANGEVYASRTSAVDWSTISCAGGAAVSAEMTALNINPSDGDSHYNTYFNTTAHPAFLVGGKSIPAGDCNATTAYVNNATTSNYFYQILLQDGGNNIVYTTLINQSATGFDGKQHDFELLVGEDGHGNTASTPYYFYVELS